MRYYEYIIHMRKVVNNMKKVNKIVNITHHYISSDSNIDDEWRHLIYDGISTNYEVNRNGVVRNIETGHILKYELSNTGYNRVIISICGSHKKISLHRLLAILFIPIPEEYLNNGYTQMSLEPNHIDGNRLNCAISNLEWTTPRGNTIHAFENGLANISMGEQSHLAKITEETARKICDLLSKGYSIKSISKGLKVSRSLVSHIRYGECWKMVSRDYIFPPTKVA